MLSDEVQGELQLKVLQERIPENEKHPPKKSLQQKITGLIFLGGFILLMDHMCIYEYIYYILYINICVYTSINLYIYILYET